ncbi:MAG TPA: hypothetical protein VHC21_03400 [Candidatus Saccharimonadales bacterium]|nr:hypothetical protein [Candidatus Saccharimonadales bacterium]
MKTIDTEKLLRVYVVVSTVLLILVLASSFYMYGKLKALEQDNKTTHNALGAIANGVRQACNCGVDY